MDFLSVIQFFLSYWWVYAILLFVPALITYYVTSYFMRTKYARKLEKQIEQKTNELRASETRYKTIFEESKDAVIVTSPEGQVLDVNPAGLDLFGYSSKDEIIKISVTKDLYVNAADRRKLIRALNTKGFVRNLELLLKHKDGHDLTVLLSSTLFFDVSRQTNTYLSILKDVTQRWQMKDDLAQVQKMESVGMLAGGIAHDFNNILGGILGYASLMKLQLSKDEKFYKFVESIEKSAERGADLTNQLLVFARKGRAKLKTVQLNRSVRETIKIIQSTFPKTIEIEVHLSDRIPSVQADEAQLHQIIMNLCVNARDAIQGTGRISINTKSIYIDDETAKLHTNITTGQFVLLEVIDNGIGMDQGTAKRIFEPFFTTKEQGRGTGLGLSMIYGFVKGHNGFIDVESNPGKGSIFRIFLPAVKPPSSVFETDKSIPQGNDELILIVDDEIVLRDFLKQALEGYGYKTLLAENGEKGIELFKVNKGEIRLIILDMIMPKLSGEQTLKRIREIDSNVNVLIASGYSEKDKFEDIGRQKISGILHKPFRINKLLSQIRTILDG